MDAAVIVVGAGPAGLMLAGELRLAGAEVLVLERLAERSGQSRGVGFTSRTMEIFDQRGLLPRFGPLELSTRAHFGGIPLDLAELGGVHQAASTVPQWQTETVLEKWATELGADIRRGITVTGLHQDDDHVEVSTKDGQTFRAQYLVGCDGGRSFVRRAAGFSFPGTDSTRELLLADVRGLALPPRLPGSSAPGGLAMCGRMPDGVTRLILCEHGVPPREPDTPVDYAEVAAAWQRLTGEDVGGGEPVWVSAFGDAARLAETYRRGRVLLAGDAAHIHLAAGGQGMNTGIQDAVNLGWKLAAVATGRMPEALLDTYHAERHPVGERLLTNTRAQGELMLSGATIAPLKQVLAELTALPEVRRHLAAMVSGQEIRYDLAPGEHPLLGARLPHWRLDRGGSTTELLRAGRGLLLDLTGSPVLRERAAGWTDRVDLVPTASQDAAGVTAVLARPDGHIAWIAPGTRHDLATALTRWFGEDR